VGLCLQRTARALRKSGERKVYSAARFRVPPTTTPAASSIGLIAQVKSAAAKAVYSYAMTKLLIKPEIVRAAPAERSGRYARKSSLQPTGNDGAVVSLSADERGNRRSRRGSGLKPWSPKLFVPAGQLGQAHGRAEAFSTFSGRATLRQGLVYLALAPGNCHPM